MSLSAPIWINKTKFLLVDDDEVLVEVKKTGEFNESKLTHCYVNNLDASGICGSDVCVSRT